MTKIKFNPEQQRAVDFYEGAIGVISSAGSGKSSMLVGRIENLVKYHKVPSHKVLAITFTKNTSQDLKEKLSKAGCENVNVGTFHAICAKVLYQEGIQITGYNLVKDWQIDNCFKNIDKKSDMKEITSFISYQKNHMRSYNDDFVKKYSEYTEDQLRKYFKAYEDMKKQKGLYDFDDFLLLCLDILRKNPGKYTYNFVLVDEHQDSNYVQNLLLKEWCQSGNIFAASDYRQCFLPDTLIKTPNGYKKIKDVADGDEIVVAGGRGDSVDTPVTEVLSKRYQGRVIKLETKNGNVIRATPEHTIFINTIIPKMRHFVYLMYKEEYGFRIGITSQYKVLREGVKTTKNGYDNRIRYENGDKLWVIKDVDTVQEAIYYENYYAYNYGIPQYVFKSRDGGKHSLPQEKVQELFKNIPTKTRGMKLLNDRGLYFDEPHAEPLGFLMSDNEDNNKKVKRRIGFTLFGSSRKSKSKETTYRGNFHEIGLTSIDEGFVKTVADSWGKNYHNRYNGSGITKYSHARWTGYDHDSMMDLSEQACRKHGNADILRRAVLTEDSTVKFQFMPITNAIAGMSVPVYQDGIIVEDEIVSVDEEYYEGKVYDLNVDHYRNFIANNIVVHNCIYRFRGGNPEYSMEFEKYWDNAVMHNVFTNYRSANNIVEQSNHFIKQYYGDYKHYMDATANTKEDGHISVHSHITRDTEATQVVNKIEQLLGNKEEPNEIAVLYRLNKHADFIEAELKRREIEYDIANNSSFFKRNEIAGLIAYLRLAQNIEDDNAFEKIFKLRNMPLKFFSNKIFSDIQNHADRHGLSMYDAFTTMSFDKPWQHKNMIIFKRNMNKLRDWVDEGTDVIKLINGIIRIFQMNTYIEEKYSNQDEINERKESMDVLKSFVKGNNLEQFITYVYSTTDKKKKKKNAVQLMTIHRSKGLEFNNVFLVGVEDKQFPSERSENLKEEANLFYVATTRPKWNLFIHEIGTGNKFIREYGVKSTPESAMGEVSPNNILDIKVEDDDWIEF